MKFKLFFLSALFAFSISKAGETPKAKIFASENDVFGTRVFMENNGLYNDAALPGNDVKFAFDNGEEKILFTNKGLVYKLIDNQPLTERQKEALEHGKKLKADKVYFVEMTWANANPNIQIEKSEKTNHYFTGGPAEVSAYGYKKITYKNVYNGIDIEYTIPKDKPNGIKYNLILHPGANAADIKIVYSGDLQKITKNGNDIVIKTPLEDITEHAPESFYQNNEVVASAFTLQNNIIGFSFPNGYNSTKTLVIDPWVTSALAASLATNGYGLDVDYDNVGNLYVYGGTFNFKIAKYTAGGALVWTFLGVVTTPAWNTSSLPGNFVVDKVSQKIFTGEGINGGGTRIIRLDANGVYDNMITAQIPLYREIWDMGYHCGTGNIYGLGGSTGSNMSAGIVNQTLQTINAITFVPAFGTVAHDVVCNTIDEQGNVFLNWASVSTIPLNNCIARINAAFNATVWAVPSTYTSFQEAANKPYVGGAYGSNGFNALAVNGNFLYYYDGLNLAAYNKATGAKIGFTTVGGHTVKQQGGIAVDDCDNVYIGGNNGSVLSYKFNGTSFSVQGPIALNVTTTNKYVYDIRLDKANNLLYVSGSGFAGTFSAIHSLNCVVNQYTVIPSCSSAVGSITTTISGPIYSYTWSNSGGVFSTTNNSAISSNTVTGLTVGNYTLSMQINAPCGPIFTKTFAVSPPSATITPSPKTCAVLGTATAVVAGGTAPISFTWTSSASTTSVATGLSQGNQTVVLSDATGCKNTFTYTVGFVNTLTTTVTGTNVLCFGGSTGSASATVNGGSGIYTYQWSNSQTTPSVAGLTAGLYTVTGIDGAFCTHSVTVLITQPPALTLTINSSTTNICAGGLINVNGFISGGTAPYTYTWSPGPNTSAYNISEAVAGNYNYILNSTDLNGCTISNNINLTFNPIPVVAATSQTVCYGDKVILTANGADTYVWNPGNIQGNTYTTTGVSNLYLTVVGTAQAGGCSSSATAAVVVNPIPQPQISASNNKGCVPLCMTFTASNSGNAVQSCNWEFGDGSFASNQINSDRCFNMAGNYTVTATVTDINGCVSKTTYSLEAYPLPIADFNYAPLKPIENDEVTFTDASHAATIAKWDWYFKDLPKPHSNYQNPVYMYSEAGTYAIALLVTSNHGCTDTIVRTIIVGEDYGIYVPNIFSPNGDGVNDVFQPKGFGIKKYELRIFNRWGEQLMFTNDFFQGWDGMWKGKLSKEDVYVWKINLTNVFGKSHELSGNVTLIK